MPTKEAAAKDSPEKKPLDVKLIYLNTSNIREDDDPLLPYRMEFNLRPPDFMNVAFAFLHGGSEEGVVKGKTVQDLVDFAESPASDAIAAHPRLRRIRISDPQGRVVKSRAQGQPWRDGDVAP